MRSWYSMAIFIGAGLLAALVIGFQRDLLFARWDYDAEQEGLKDRIILKFSHVVAENTPKGLAAEHFSRLVAEKTNGRVEVQVFPNGMLHSEETEVQALQSGEIQMIAPAVSNLSAVNPVWSALDLPYLFWDQEEMNRGLSGPIGTILFRSLEEYNMKGLAFWNNGFKQMTSRRGPLYVPHDFAGQRFRIIPSKVLAAQMQALDAVPVPMGFNEVYRELESGRIDGEENTISNIASRRLYQFQRNMTLSNHGYLGYAVVTSKPFWEKLPPDVRSSIEEAMKETTAWSNEQAMQLNEAELANIRQNTALVIHQQTPEEREQWLRAFEPLYKQFAPELGEDLMREINRLHARRAR
ncbi:MAG: DctP family TRAP transporter solute-binding subunit [Clostridia bacterium]